MPLSTHDLNRRAVVSSSLPQGQGNAVGGARTDAGDDLLQRVAVIREEIEVQRERTVTGSVRVRVEPKLHTQSIDVTATMTQVDVERVAVDREVEAVQPPWRDGDTWVVPVYEETVVVQRRLVLKEELRLHTRRDVVQDRQEVQLRRDEVHIERLDADGRWVAASVSVSDGLAVAGDLSSSAGTAGETRDL